MGYALIIVLIGGIVGTYLQEWRQLEALDAETRHIRLLRQSVHEVYVRMVELSLIGETVMEWDTIHSNRYHTQRLEIDTLLCGFKHIYPLQCMDSTFTVRLPLPLADHLKEYSVTKRTVKN